MPAAGPDAPVHAHPYAPKWLCNHNEWGVGPQVKADEEYPLAINVLGIVAVLIANVTYLGYITPPGGTHPTWDGCVYHVFIAFFVLNGLAFIFSMCAIWLMVFVPLRWLTPGRPSKLGHNTVVWWGAVHVAFAMLCLLAAFTTAGLVSVGFHAPDYDCGILHCDSGGVYCTRHTYARESRALNKFKGPCYQVFRVTNGAYVKATANYTRAYTAANASALLSGLPAFDISLPYSSGQALRTPEFDDKTFDDNACYFWGKEVLSGFDDSNFEANNTLCLVPSAFPDGADARGGLAFDLFTILAKEAILSLEDRAIWQVNYTGYPYQCPTPSTCMEDRSGLPWEEHAWVVPTTINKGMCDLEALHNGTFSFFTDKGIVSIIDGKYGVDEYDDTVDGTHNTATFADSATVIVHDELPYRCQLYNETSGDRTWCHYLPKHPTRSFNGSVYRSTPRCSNGEACKHLAVEIDGSYIQLSDLARLVGDGNHVLPPKSVLLTSVEAAVFCIMSIGGAVNVGILIWFVRVQHDAIVHFLLETISYLAQFFCVFE